MDDGRRLLVVSPLRNEAAHLELVAGAVAAQTRPPDLWLAIDDGSTDGTWELARRLAGEIPFLRVLRTPARFTDDRGDRHAAAAAPRAFNRALRSVDRRAFTHVGKLDGDVELPERYFEALLREFDRDPRLGIAGGTIVERTPAGWAPAPAAEHHVRGALKLYRRECLEAIGGVRERLGWDGIDGTYARMHGWTTRSFAQLPVRHHRPLGSADGAWRGRVRRGEVHWVLGFGPAWSALKALQIGRGPGGAGAGAAFLYGYAAAAARGVPRVEDPDYRRFMRAEQRARLRRSIRRAAVRPAG